MDGTNWRLLYVGEFQRMRLFTSIQNVLAVQLLEICYDVCSFGYFACSGTVEIVAEITA